MKSKLVLICKDVDGNKFDYRLFAIELCLTYLNMLQSTLRACSESKSRNNNLHK